MADEKESQKEKVKSQKAKAAVPRLVLTADKPGHLRAVIALHRAMPELGLESLVREFELFEESQR